MGRGVLAHVHAEAILSTGGPPRRLEHHPADGRHRTHPREVHTGLAHLRQVAAARGLPPVTWDRQWGYRLLDNAPEVWIGYERAFFGTVHHRVANFIAGILLPHQTETPDDPSAPSRPRWARLSPPFSCWPTWSEAEQEGRMWAAIAPQLAPDSHVAVPTS